ncbi:MAG: hypothetical protein U0R72_01925 [Nakamurella multipartita]|jgi:hypothetical protein
MSSIEERLRRGLEQRADRIEVSGDAWTRLQARVAGGRGSRARWRAPSVIAAAVVVVVGATVIAVQAARSDPSAPFALAPGVSTESGAADGSTRAQRSIPPSAPAAPLASTTCAGPAEGLPTTRIAVTGRESELTAAMSMDAATLPGHTLACIRIVGAGFDVADGVGAAAPAGVLQYAHVTAVPGGSVVWGAATVIAVAVTMTDANGESTVVELDASAPTATGWVYFAVFEPDGRAPVVDVAALDSAARLVGDPIRVR